MRILYGYTSSEGSNNRQGLTDLRLQHIKRLSQAGFNLKPFDMSYSKEFKVLNFNQLNKKWKWKDRRLMELYKRFIQEVESCDVFYNSVGVNFHPEFVSSIPQFTVFGCNDDPENSHNLSRPVAKSYDMCAIGNIAEVETYKSWGVKNVFWQPMGFTPDMFNPNLKLNSIINGKRNIELSMVIDKLSPYRRKRMEVIDLAFPDAHFYGRGWKRGYLPMGEEVNLLQESKIGLNIHNSTGPINRRLFYLPANGVMQICDNKDYLGKIFELDKEVVGFDNISEAIELTHFYLNNDEERINIAANGWKRALKDYNEVAVFKRLNENIIKTREGNVKNVKTVSFDSSSIEKIYSYVDNRYESTKRSLKKVVRKIIQ